jgi:hypothetical protein
MTRGGRRRLVGVDQELGVNDIGRRMKPEPILVCHAPASSTRHTSRLGPPVNIRCVSSSRAAVDGSLLASAYVLNLQRSSSSHSRVAKKLSHTTLS